MIIKFPTHIVILIGIFTLGIALRSVELINHNYLFGHDMGRDMLIARSMVEEKKLRLIGNEVGSGFAGINGIFHGPGYHYVLALGYILFHGDPYGGLVMMAFFGYLSLILGYYCAKKIYGHKTAYFILLYLSISYLVVSQSRFIWSSHIATPIIILSLYFIYRIAENSTKYAPLAIFTAASVYQSQLGVAVPMVLAIFVSMILIYRNSSFKVYGYSIAALILALSPMILFEMRHDFLAFRGLYNYISSGSGVNAIPVERIYDHFQFYYFNFINTFTYEFGAISQNLQKISVYPFVPFVIFLTLYNQKVFILKFHLSLYIMVIVTWIAFLILNNVVWDYYLMHLRIAYIYLFGYASYEVVKNFRKGGIQKLYFVVFLLFFVVFFSGAAYQVYTSYSHDLFDPGGYHKIYGKKYALDAIYADASGKNFNLLIFTPYVYTYPYDYLLETYAFQKYGYMPGTVKKNLTYLLIEPDYDKPWRQNGWLETVTNGGKIIFRKDLPSEQILEKREYE